MAACSLRSYPTCFVDFFHTTELIVMPELSTKTANLYRLIIHILASLSIILLNLHNTFLVKAIIRQ